MLILTNGNWSEMRETPAQKSALRETPQAQSEEAPEPPAESELLERKSTGKINRAKW
jgi:hypothetical protein